MLEWILLHGVILLFVVFVHLVHMWSTAAHLIVFQWVTIFHCCDLEKIYTNNFSIFLRVQDKSISAMYVNEFAGEQLKTDPAT